MIWLPCEDEFLDRHYGKSSNKFLERRLGRSWQDISDRANERGLTPYQNNEQRVGRDGRPVPPWVQRVWGNRLQDDVE